MSDLRDRLTGLLRRVGATQEPSPLVAELLAAWSEPGRVYHDVRHLEDCLAQLDDISPTPAVHDVVELALWFHDAKYDSRATDNEERSAQWATEGLSAARVPRAVVAEVARLVRLTREHGPAHDEAGRLVCDIDLSILGRPGDAFDEYERRIRAEYAWVPESAYRQGRSRILAAFLRREPLFQTEAFRREFETPARANLRRALEGLRPAT